MKLTTKTNKMKNFTFTQIAKVAKTEKVTNSTKFTSKGKNYNVVYSTDLNKWYLNTTNNEGQYVTLGEINN